MAIHPYNTKLRTYEGTRLLTDHLDLVGCTLPDPHTPTRLWTIQALFAPIPQRRLGGLRAQLMDQRGFMTFLNQRDLEVLLGYGLPGKVCPWLGSLYVAVGARDWCGLCVDLDDLIDDLQVRELQLRVQSLHQGQGQQLQPGRLLSRRLHREEGHDEEEELVLLYDQGYSDLEGLENRWDRTRRRIEWQRASLIL